MVSIADPNDVPTLTLATLARGAAEELFQQELPKVLENILDPNTEPESKRTISLKITLLPSKERTQVGIGVEIDSKLAAFRGAGGMVFVGRRMGKPIAVPHDPNQLQIRWDEEAQPHPLRPETAAPSGT